jgi:hypothetical protein
MQKILDSDEKTPAPTRNDCNPQRLQRPLSGMSTIQIARLKLPFDGNEKLSRSRAFLGIFKNRLFGLFVRNSGPSP